MTETDTQHSPHLLVILASGPGRALRGQEALDLVYAGLALDWRVSLLLQDAALAWLRPDAADPQAGPGARALPALADYGLERLCAVSDLSFCPGLNDSSTGMIVEWLDAAAVDALRRTADHILEV